MKNILILHYGRMGKNSMCNDQVKLILKQTMKKLLALVFE